MTTLNTPEKKYQVYRNEVKRLEEQRDAWYTIASQKFSEGDEKGQAKAYEEIDAIRVMLDAMVNPMEGEALKGDEGLLSFDS